MFSSEALAAFNELETSLYDYICKNNVEVIYMRIRDLTDVTQEYRCLSPIF
jgi:DNA-binding MurR/RpiR family transcriptional regulator